MLRRIENQMSMWRSLLVSSCLCLGLSLVGCQKSVAPSIENDPAEQSKAQAVASRYMEAFMGGDVDQVLSLSLTPFWGDGDLVTEPDALQAEVEKQLGNLTELDAQVEATHFMTLAQTEVVFPRLYRRLKDQAFTDKFYVVAVLVRINGNEERGVVLVQPDADGIWKVIGMGN